MKPVLKPVLQNFSLFIVSLIIALGICEITLRLIGYGPGNPLARLLNNNDEYVGYRMIPGSSESVKGPGGIYDVKIVDLGFDDGRGFRDDGREDPVYSLFFGDSFVWGFGVDIDDSVSEQFERLTGKDAVNFGMTSFTSPTQYSRLFSLYGPKLNAHFAFFGIFLGNDLGDCKNFDEWLLSGKKISYPEWRSRQIRGLAGHSGWWLHFRLFAYKHIALWRFIADRVNFGFTDGGRPQDDLFKIKTENLDLVLDRKQIETRLSIDQDRQNKLFRHALQKIVETGRSTGTRPIAFIIPTKELVYQSFYPEGPNRTIEDVRYPIILKLLKESGIDFIDLLPVFRQAVADGAGQLYFRVDGHWNPAGHALAASELQRFVTTQLGN